MGDMAVPYSGGAGGGSVRQSTLPVARIVRRQDAADAEREHAPGSDGRRRLGTRPCARAAEFIVYGAAYSLRQSSLPLSKGRMPA